MKSQILWLQSEATAELMSRLGLEAADGSLPLMQKIKTSTNETANYDVFFSLLSGILYCWGAGHWAIKGGPASEQTQKRILTTLGRGFNFQSIEKLVVNSASRVRNDFGLAHSLQILENGLKIEPTSSIIKSDLIITAAVWNSRNGPDHNIAELILESFTGVDLQALDDDPRQIMLASVISAKVFLGRDIHPIDEDVKRFWPFITIAALTTVILELSRESFNRQDAFIWLSMFD